MSATALLEPKARLEEPDARRAAFYLCLSRAFLPPPGRAARAALGGLLAEDLEELAGGLGYPCAAELRALRAALAEVPGPLALLRCYSELFLVPPAPVPLNAGLYLDGAVMGPFTAEVEARYAGAGLARSERFRDLPDHVALQLEFVAYLCACEAQAGEGPARSREFLASCVEPWLAPFVAALEQACARNAHARVYLSLARILQAALAGELRGRPAVAEAFAR
ncbi:MAG TPA: molecular chaperone TorD family protein [Burkholderiales bacterium]|nr:molecular chaperone TorD family protein [Burkholderiales bacterium]